MDPRISACIVSYNDYDEALHAAESVLRHCPKAQLLVVDNASPDGTGPRLQEALAGRARVLCSPRNLGFGKAHNLAIPSLQSEYHFVLNPDISFDGPVLQEMAAWLDANPDVVMATPQLYFPDGRPQHLPRRAPNVLGLAARQLPKVKALQRYDRRYTMQDEGLDAPVDIEFCTGSFFCMRTAVFRAIQGFDPGYFMYVEDADITRKALRHGRVQLLPQFAAVHAWHRSPHKSLGPFVQQLSSMARYFSRWGFRLAP